MKRLMLAVAALAVWATAVAAQERPFDPQTWPKTPAATDQTRKAMVRDLVDSRRLVGLTRDQVTALLGQGQTLGPGVLYQLGSTPVGDFNPSDLSVIFSEAGAVTEVMTNEDVFDLDVPQVKFDPAGWPKEGLVIRHEPRAPGSGHWQAIMDPTRFSMWRDLIASGVLSGLTRVQVTALLGQPQEVTGGAVPTAAYQLAPGLYLAVMFDERGRVRSAGTLTPS